MVGDGLQGQPLFPLGRDQRVQVLIGFVGFGLQGLDGQLAATVGMGRREIRWIAQSAAAGDTGRQGVAGAFRYAAGLVLSHGHGQERTSSGRAFRPIGPGLSARIGISTGSLNLKSSSSRLRS
jgi:hypothetical protein